MRANQPPMNMNMAGQTPMRFNPQQPQQQQMPPSSSKRPMPQLPPPPGINPMNPARQQHHSQRNRKRRNLDRAIMTEIAEAYPEGQSYVDLLAIESRLDALLLRKRMNVQEALKRPQKMKKRMRVFISHVFLPGREPREGDPGTVPMWELRVEGRLFEDCAPNQLDLPPSQLSNAQSLAARNKRKFSTFFKSLVIELDKEIYGPDNHLVEWHRSPHTSETDGFQVKRPGDRDVTCTILLSLDYQPMKYKLQASLAKLLGIALETRPKVIEALWQYIRSHNLQDVKTRDCINCDDMLQKIFQTKTMRFMEIPQRVQALLSPPDPIVIRHVIRKTDNEKPVTSCYDVDVDLDDPLRQTMTNFFNSTSNSQEIQNLDTKLYELSEQVSEWKQRVDYYKRFSENPREFLVRWLQSQEADLKNMAARGELKGMKNPFPDQALQGVDRYLQPDMQEGAFRYFYNRICRLRKELEMGINSKTYM